MNKKSIINLEEDTNNFQFKNNSKSINLSISFNRIAFIFFVFSLFFLIFSLKLIYLGNADFINKKNSLAVSDFRSTIVDRNGNILAKSIITKNIGINPSEVIDTDKLLINLKLIFPSKDFNQIKKKLKKINFFI